MEYGSRKALHHYENGCYKYLQRNKWLESCFPPTPHRNLIEALRLAKQYKNRSHCFTEDVTLYRWLQRTNNLDIAYPHKGRGSKN